VRNAGTVMRSRRFADSAVARVFASYPPQARRKLLAVRELIFATAAATSGVGPLTETLKWGEPAYVTAATRSGSTIRLGWKGADPGRYALYFHCRTNLVQRFRTTHADALEFEGNRAIVLDVASALPRTVVRDCVAAALTYHRRRSTRD
jgi:uncharacterized protein DUF1801